MYGTICIGSFAGYILAFLVLDYKYGGNTAGKNMNPSDYLVLLGGIGLGATCSYLSL